MNKNMQAAQERVAALEAELKALCSKPMTKKELDAKWNAQQAAAAKRSASIGTVDGNGYILAR